jgi:hypothetical protein
MPTVQDMLDQAFQAGRDAERKMAAIAASGAVTFSSEKPSPTQVVIANAPSGNGARKRGRVKTELTETVSYDPPLKPAKTTIVARGVKKAGAPRTKGVKSAIISLIGEQQDGATTADIIAKLGFKATSVNATLMSLKKKGLAAQDGKVWFLTASATKSSDSNSETEASADYGF